MSYEEAQRRFSRRIIGLREDAGLTVRDFCAKCGISVPAYNYYANKGGMPNLYTAMAIADAFGLTLDQLIGIKGGREKRG